MSDPCGGSSSHVESSPGGSTPDSPPRLKATRTYGRQRPRHPSPDYNTASSSSYLYPSSSSPLPSSFFVTPPSSPPRPTKRARTEVSILTGVDEDGDESVSERRVTVKETIKKENIPPTSAKPTSGIAKQGTLKGFFAPLPRLKAKQPLRPSSIIPSSPAPASSSSAPPSFTKPTPSTRKAPSSTPNLQQTQLMHLPLLQSCKGCGMTYVRGGEDEAVHARHHGRVLRGIPWEGLGRGMKGQVKGEKGWKELAEVSFSKGSYKGKGRLVVCDGSWGGAKLEDILSTVDLSLSSPALPTCILERCRIFLFLTSSPPPPISGASGKKQRPDLLNSSKSGRSSSNGSGGAERIVSVVVAQGIKWAMRVLEPEEVKDRADGEVRAVDSGGGVMCDPTPLDTPLGIHRLYTIPSYRSLGLAHILLESTREHTVYGCTFDPTKGEVAFSQPTESGQAAMQRWGGGKVRVFVDDESQL